ncbi:MAG TPA: type II secretion system F family protein [Terriglobales bacterium]|jgi:tight adherence protein C|nr:type II secretion system F family protein [Terriglobales bacterium]
MTFIALGIGLFFGFLFLVLLLMPRPSAAGALLDQVTRGGRVADEVPAWRAALNVEYLAKPFTVIRALFSPEPNPELVHRLALAGYRSPAHADVFLGLRLAIPAVLGVLVAMFVSKSTVFVFLMAVVTGFFLPDFWLSNAITRRRQKIKLSLPDGLDFLAICLEAGLGLDQGMVRLASEMRVSHPELSEEFAQINFEQRAGVPRIQAWKTFSDRVDLESVRSFVAMLIQTERFGTPVSKSLGMFSDALRTARRQKAEELAAKTTIKMVFPLVFFIFPTMAIVVMLPAFISIVRNLENFIK